MNQFTEPLFLTLFYVNIAIWIGLLILIVAHFTRPPFYSRIQSLMKGRVRWIAWAFPVVSMFGSLWLSEIAQFTPCLLCQYQRYAMYPLVVVLGVAAFKTKEKSPKIIAMILAGIGLLIALYHYVLQRLAFVMASAPCSEATPCTTMYLGYWGFYSVPLFAACGFAAVLVLLWLFDRKDI